MQKQRLEILAVEEELPYRNSENKGADQLCRYCTDDQRLCFRICISPISSARMLYSLFDTVVVLKAGYL